MISWQKIKNFIKLAKVDSSDDSENYPKMKVSFNGKTKDVLVLTPYGVSCRPPSDSLAICFNVLGQESTVFAIANDYINRFKDLKEGELATGNYLTSSRTFYDADGNTVVFSAANASLAGTTVYLGDNDGSTDVLKELSNALQAVSDALDATTTALYPSSMGPAGPMAPPEAATVLSAKASIDTVKSKIDAINGGAPNVD